MSFSKAAQNLFMTQPTVTHQIAALEEEIGFQLFNRGYRSISLTPAGLHFAESMKVISQQIKNAISESQALMRQHSSFLTISHYSPEGDNWFYQAVQAFTGLHSDYNIDIRLPGAGVLGEHLLERKLDAVIMPEEALPKTDELCSVPIFSNPEYCIMSRNHPLAALPTVTLDQIGDIPCMQHASGQGEVIPWHEHQILQRKEQRVLPGGHTMREMITNIRSQPCVMFSLYPLMFISDDLVRIPFADGPVTQTVLAWRRDNDKPALLPLVEFIAAFYQENAD